MVSIRISSHLDSRTASHHSASRDILTLRFTGRKQREVSRAEAEQFAKEEGLLFLEASAKTGENVDRVRQLLCVIAFI